MVGGRAIMVDRTPSSLSGIDVRAFQDLWYWRARRALQVRAISPSSQSLKAATFGRSAVRFETTM